MIFLHFDVHLLFSCCKKVYSMRSRGEGWQFPWENKGYKWMKLMFNVIDMCLRVFFLKHYNDWKVFEHLFFFATLFFNLLVFKKDYRWVFIRFALITHITFHYPRRVGIICLHNFYIFYIENLLTNMLKSHHHWQPWISHKRQFLPTTYNTTLADRQAYFCYLTNDSI